MKIFGQWNCFLRQLTEYCQINVSRECLQYSRSFQHIRIATGAKRGDEDVNAHLRKGIGGRLRNHFGKSKTEFKKHMVVLIDTGYEKT